jgi:ribosome-binding protein aMBF1 (putative translation factor)
MNNNDNNSIQLHDQIRMALNKSSYTTHAFAQQMNIKLSTLESYIDGREIPEKKTIKRMNKFLSPIKIII